MLFFDRSPKTNEGRPGARFPLKNGPGIRDHPESVTRVSRVQAHLILRRDAHGLRQTGRGGEHFLREETGVTTLANITAAGRGAPWHAVIDKPTTEERSRGEAPGTGFAMVEKKHLQTTHRQRFVVLTFRALKDQILQGNVMDASQNDVQLRGAVIVH